jgi:type IV pilus assembly protein PilA
MQNRKGFTLVEILVSVVIVGILAAAAIPKFIYTKQKAVLASMRSDLRNMVSAEEAYYSDSKSYAPAIGPVQKAGVAAFIPTKNNTMVLSTVTVNGWAAVASNATLKSGVIKCGIYVGKGTPPNIKVKVEGGPACY